MNEINSHSESDSALSQLGLLGLGSRSTLFYIEQLNIGFNKKCAGDSTCRLLLLNSNFAEFNPYLPNQWSKLQPVLTKYLQALANLPVVQIIIPNITLHECYDRLLRDREINALNIIHPVSSTIQQLQKKKLPSSGAIWFRLQQAIIGAAKTIY